MNQVALRGTQEEFFAEALCDAVGRQSLSDSVTTLMAAPSEASAS